MAGDPLAQAILAYRYATGRGVARNHRTAAYWDRLAADGGNVSAQYNLAQSYYLGHGVEKNAALALDLYARVWQSAKADDDLRAVAAVNLGWHAQQQQGDEALATAIKWNKRAARLGDAKAFYNLGHLKLRTDDFRDAAQWFRLGSVLGHAKSKYELARLLVGGLVDGDPTEAVALLRSARRTVPAAARLLNSKKLKRYRERATFSGSSTKVDKRLEGTWKIRDSPSVMRKVRVGKKIVVSCWDDEEDFIVSNIRWRNEQLSFDTLCPSTQWLIHNGVSVIDGNTLLLVRTGASKEPSILRRVTAASAKRFR